MTPPEIVFTLARGQNVFFGDLAHALVFELERLGARARVASGEFPTVREGSVNVILPPHEFAVLTGVPNDARALARCVLISAEQPQSVFFGGNVELARHAGAVLDINPRAVRNYHGAGVGAEHLQLGYSEAWDRRPEVSERTIDILFAGRASVRREQALASYADLLERFRCHILLSDDNSPNTASSPNFLAGEEKLRLLAQSKVLLNIHGDGEPYFEWLRVAEAISSGCVVVSEHSTDVEPLRPGQDFLSGRLESLGALAAYAAEDDAERARVAASAEARLRAEATLAEGATTLLAAATRIDASPLAPEQVLSSRTVGVQVAMADPKFAPARFDDGVAAGEHRILRALKRNHFELLSMRRQLAREELARRRPENPAPQVVEVGASPGSDPLPRPRVSVIVPLYNDADVVGEALDSVEQSTFQNWEIIVIDDASGDRSGALVLDWIEAHPERRCRLVRHEINAGLSRARNTGISLANGDLLLMLDSDNRMRRLGLARLVEALDRDRGAAFAYGFLDKFSDEEAVGLVSRFAWEPERFRQGNFIDALALVRRATLRRFGGYSEDSRLALGLEDYDLWARFAETGERGAFVRNFVASYRAGHSSMVSVTSISFADAHAAIAEHAPKLMRGVEIV
jgi:hypothetical protein